MSEQNSDLINNLCLPKGWRENADLFNQDAEKTAAVGFTPCFEQLVIMSPVYIIVIILTLIRFLFFVCGVFTPLKFISLYFYRVD